MFIFVIATLYKKNRCTNKSIIPIILGLISIFFFYYFGVRIPATTYNIFIFIPVIYFIILKLISDQEYNILYKHVLKSFLLFMFCISIISLSRHFMVNYYSYTRGLSYNHFIKYIEERIDKGETLHLNASFIPVFYDEKFDKDDLKRIKFILSDEIQILEPDNAILKQANTGNRKPPEINGYNIENNNFYKDDLKFLRIKFLNTLKAYNFAHYKIIPDKSKETTNH